MGETGPCIAIVKLINSDKACRIELKPEDAAAQDKWPRLSENINLDCKIIAKQVINLAGGGGLHGLRPPQISP